MKPVEPILLADRFAELQSHLLTLLRDLRADEWKLPTVLAGWTVHDLAAHLLDTDLRRLSYQRDRHPLLEPRAGEELLPFLNRLNAEWVHAARRLSPAVLVELTALAAPQVVELFRSLDPYAPAVFAVAWAGEDASRNWLDVAREYTEKWIHQEQIREATGRPGLTRRRLLHPVLDTFLRALPHTYRDVAAARGTEVGVVIEGEAGDEWTLRRDAAAWKLFEGLAQQPAVRVRLDQDTAWKLFSTSRRKGELVGRVEIEGDRALGEPVLGMVSVMA